MTNEEIAKYLSTISSVKESIIDNLNSNNISDEESKKYHELYKAFEKASSSLSDSLKLDNNTNNYEEIFKKLDSPTKNLISEIKPDLKETLEVLKNQYENELNKWKEASDVSHSLAKFSQALAKMSQTNIMGTPVKIEKTNSKEKIKMSGIKINKITLSNFRFFTDDTPNNTFEPNKHGMLIYGENGSGKSSLFKAFEFLSKTKIEEKEFKDNKNIFKFEEPTSLNFEFDNSKSLTIGDDNLEIDKDDIFIRNLSIFKPILSYQELLKVSYNENNSINEQKNLYTFFEKILEDYPILGTSKRLKDFEDEEHFAHFKRIIEKDLFSEINNFLEKFKHNFKITKIKLSGVGKKAYLEIDYFDNDITDKKYHLFLNEARLSALAMSIYFSIIKKQFDLLEEDSLKILVLDDLLISFDMNNRLNLLKILQDEFNDYQIFFFTHERGLFELINEKMNLQSYEIYVQKKDDIEVPFIKQSNSLIEQAKYQKETQNYGCSANLLRQHIEKILCNFLPKEQILDRKCKIATLDTLLGKAINFEDTKPNKNQRIVDIFKALKTYKKVLLNEASHYNSTDIYKLELEDTISIIDELEKII